MARYGDILEGQWCPYRKQFKTEKRCRAAFERLTDNTSPKKHPRWLEGLELDGHCEELGVAFEYQGAQHSRYVPFSTGTDPKTQRDRDRRTREGCDDEGVALVVLWHNDPDLEGTIIRKELELLGVLP